MTLRVIRDSGAALDREALQQRGNELATQIKRSAADAIQRSMIPDVFTRGEQLTRARMLTWRSQAAEAIKAWQQVDGLI
ncbi:hypothetical protein [Microbacterium sp. VKM Ac-2923]|uniref:hypothetical protein n=1 Tax=Microbacterium sp. VKM Ac-2923 TaxID=2929476 RepID=UPI001FB1F755|nr:hypothetical protein [Microbacterium sp. VKM Ac-2923]MCJ1709211.1 hypothetical protein [Microbacterium sp. VKM Ac-2923]